MIIEELVKKTASLDTSSNVRQIRTALERSPYTQGLSVGDCRRISPRDPVPPGSVVLFSHPKPEVGLLDKPWIDRRSVIYTPDGERYIANPKIFFGEGDQVLIPGRKRAPGLPPGKFDTPYFKPQDMIQEKPLSVYDFRGSLREYSIAEISNPGDIRWVGKDDTYTYMEKWYLHIPGSGVPILIIDLHNGEPAAIGTLMARNLIPNRRPLIHRIDYHEDFKGIHGSNNPNPPTYDVLMRTAGTHTCGETNDIYAQTGNAHVVFQNGVFFWYKGPVDRCFSRINPETYELPFARRGNALHILGFETDSLLPFEDNPQVFIDRVKKGGLDKESVDAVIISTAAPNFNNRKLATFGIESIFSIFD